MSKINKNYEKIIIMLTFWCVLVENAWFYNNISLDFFFLGQFICLDNFI